MVNTENNWQINIQATNTMLAQQDPVETHVNAANFMNIMQKESEDDFSK